MRFHLQLRSFLRLLRVDLSDIVDLDCNVFQQGPASVSPTCIYKSRLISPHTCIPWIPTQYGCNTPALHPTMYRSSLQWDSKMSTSCFNSIATDLAHFLVVCSSLTAQISYYALISHSHLIVAPTTPHLHHILFWYNEYENLYISCIYNNCKHKVRKLWYFLL